jgi:hypothetical protein
VKEPLCRIGGKMKIIAMAVPMGLLSAGILMAGPISLNKPVTLNGSFGPYVGPYGNICGVGVQPQGSAAALDDGVFLPEQTCYQSGPVYWNTQTNTIDIDLRGTFTLNGAIVQADDNDVYELQYRDTGGTYHDWYSVPIQGSFGMITRTDLALPAVSATGLRFFAPLESGDGEFGVSEIEVFGVPEPGTIWMMLGGLTLLATAGLKRQRIQGIRCAHTLHSLS